MKVNVTKKDVLRIKLYMMEVSEERPMQHAEDLPKEVQLFSHQISGHTHGKGRLGLGMLKHQNGDILKPLFDGDPRAEREFLFFENVFKNYQSEPQLEELVNFLPAFHGVWDTNIAGKNTRYLCLEDVCMHFENPSVLCIKMGRRTYDDYAIEAKIQSQTKKFLHGETTGIRIEGMKVYDDEKMAYLPQVAKMFWKQLTPDCIINGLESYLSSNNHVNSLILCGFIHKLVQLDAWFTKQRNFKFIASSLLFVYEGTLSSWTTWTQNNDIHIFNSCLNTATSSAEENALHTVCNQLMSNDYETLNSGIDACIVCGHKKIMCTKVLRNCNLFRVAMIDFAHCFPSDKEDTNYTFGLHKLIDRLKEILKTQLENL